MLEIESDKALASGNEHGNEGCHCIEDIVAFPFAERLVTSGK